jgi:hypothetical protein
MNDVNNALKHQNRRTPVMPIRAVVGVVLGGLCGFALYRYVGCADGSCLITSSPGVSVIYCMILGFVLSQARWSGRVT